MQNGKNQNGLVTPTDRKIVGIDNKPIPSVEERLIAEQRKEEAKTRKADTVAALRDMADKIESDTLPTPNSIVAIPVFPEGVQVVLLGDKLPPLALQGLLSQLTVRMALQ